MRRLLARLLHENSGMREYNSFASALHDSDSYEDPRLIEIVKEKTRTYRDALESDPEHTSANRQALQNMNVLESVEPKRPLNVLEVGGACGASYFEARHLLPGRIRHWSIVETPAMAAAGQSLTSDPALSFHSDPAPAVSQLESRDLAIAQGVLQYTADPVQTLNDLFALEFSYVYVTRTTVADVDRPIFTKQETELAAHGPGKLPAAPEGKSTQPIILVSFASLASAIPSHYEIAFRFAESEDRQLRVAGRLVTIRDIGLLARKR